ncbi:DUF389 domain-containing protein [Desertifilum sp. FACHB-1129]|uniref:TIGR00341 family protein n=1 Tax=Desertifilum tharense IPPAS B-1220 TaxID=1781255 RepID=A0A1E5QE41_9CYAN|nr:MULTISPECIES: DUF389 domain-containing protein [Desertifilum]MDA0212298.1 DUF389 domain-containing protein [Cyanobacteria bacterium FC1]MBD2311372.1 DUF389 domain-containing protein [Desertifilum sp. FACHB-1129]MBD2321618.1 DUF389 domain-containing protein [Desertifilum sp. FACHB-866]MBD2331745.1 DUF389 domain-containing protein [Desertifilum sp. FACHB-868]OEJ72583.1 hypothetical protein BH720_24075 [Desertifilum tharense IPPAS B-1220]
MRQLFIQVPQGYGDKVVELTQEHQGVNLVHFEGKDADNVVDFAIVCISNRQIEDFLSELESVPDTHITFLPQGALALHPPASEAPQQVTNVKERSPLEIFLAGLQSVGSWRGFLSYAVVGGIVVWIGLYTNTIYLLVAAMLIAPYAGPAMNVAIATSRGDRTLLWRSIVRYFSALAVTIAVTCLLSWISQQEIATPLMVDNSQISAAAVLLPLTAGAAGALNLVQSDRSSLVPGASIGMLVAASLAPPAGIAGMAIAIGRWDMVISGIFLLLLQLAAINLSATLVFRLYGLSSQGARYQRGKPWVLPASLAVTGIALAALLGWQFSSTPEFQRSSQAQRANSIVQEVVDNSDLADLVEANVRFTRSQQPDGNTLLSVIYVQPQNGVTATSTEIQQRLTEEIQSRILAEGFNVTPLVDVNVLEEPTS